MFQFNIVVGVVLMFARECIPIKINLSFLVYTIAKSHKQRLGESKHDEILAARTLLIPSTIKRHKKLSEINTFELQNTTFLGPTETIASAAKQEKIEDL